MNKKVPLLFIPSTSTSLRSRQQDSFPVTQMEEENQSVSAGWWLAATNLLYMAVCHLCQASFNEKMPEWVCYQEQQFLPSTPVLRKEVDPIFTVTELAAFHSPNCSGTSLKIPDLMLIWNHLPRNWQTNWRAGTSQICLHFQTYLLVSLFTSLFSDLKQLHLKYLRNSCSSESLQHRGDLQQRDWCLTQLITTLGDRARLWESGPPPAIFQDKCRTWSTICMLGLHFESYMYNMVRNSLLYVFLWSLNVATRGSQARNQEKFLRPPSELIGNFGAVFRKSALPNTAWDRFQSDSC